MRLSVVAVLGLAVLTGFALLVLLNQPASFTTPSAPGQTQPGTLLSRLDDALIKRERLWAGAAKGLQRDTEAVRHVGPAADLLATDSPKSSTIPAFLLGGQMMEGRQELQPRNTGCYAATNKKQCCAAIDSRYTIHGPPFFGGSPCVPAAQGKFKSGSMCEPLLWAKGEEPQTIGSCDPAEQAKEQESLEDVIAEQKRALSMADSDSEESRHDLNLMWVTDCQLQLEWSSVLLLWSALRVGQQGDFTRIATGCETPNARRFVSEAMETVAEIFGARDRVTVHFAPKHITDSRDGTDGEVYTPYTKAFGVKHFLDHASPRNRVGVILDPDFLFNRPLEYRMDQIDAEHVIPAGRTKDWQHDIEPGRPVGQMYGLGDGWLNYNLKEICGPDSPCTKVSRADAMRYFTMGPPIFMLMSDWAKVAQGWYDYLPIIRRTRKDWMEEMRSYTMSAAHHEQKTSIFTHYQISDKSTRPDDEGWPWIERPGNNLPDPCRAGKALNPHNFPDITDPYPPILHYCQAYEPEYYDQHYFWSKYQINFGVAQLHRGNLLDCDQPFYEDPPRDLLEAQKFDDPKCLGQRRQAWMLCQVQHSLNEMLADFKKQKCGKDFNRARTAKHTFSPRPSTVDHPPSCRKPRPN